MRKKSFLLIFFVAALLYLSPQASADWSWVKRLTWTLGNSREPAIAVDSSDTIHLVWEDSTPGNSEIYYMRSTNGGGTWRGLKRLTLTPDGSYNPAISIDSSDAIHVVWYDYSPGNSEIYYRKSTDGGTNWSTARRITWTSGGSFNPAIAVDSSNTIHVVWGDSTPGDDEIFYRKSMDGGTNWSAAKRLTWNAGDSSSPDIATDYYNALRVVWEDDTPGNAEIYYRRSPDGGTNWSAAKRLTWNSASSYYPAMATDPSHRIHIVWQDYAPGNDEIYYRRSPDGGTTWTAVSRLTWNSGGSQEPDIAADSSGSVHIVWYDYTPGNDEIYYKKSTDGGTTWSAVRRLTWNIGNSGYPAIAIDSGYSFHVVWQDNTPGNFEIYYRNGN